MLVESTTPGPLKILIVDVTQNAGGFEHRVSRHLAAELSNRGVAVTDNSPALVDNEIQFSDAFSSAGSFSVALLVAHGAEDLGGNEASKLVGPGNVDEWYSLADLSAEQMQDKVLMLCVCHGYCQDAIEAFRSRVLSIIAPTSALTAFEAETFFPNFLEAIQPTSETHIDPIVLEEKLEQTNHYSRGKMRLFSEALPS